MLNLVQDLPFGLWLLLMANSDGLYMGALIRRGKMQKTVDICPKSCKNLRV